MKPYEFIIEIIKESGDLLMRKRGEEFSIEIKNKDPRDIITSIDRDINEFIINKLKKEFPSHSIYSEESDDIENTSDFLWTIDPIDGTSNFSRDIPHFAICIGLLEKNIPIAGAVYNPVTRELFSFKKGEGAFLNDKPIHVSETTELSQAHVFLHAGRKNELRDWGGESYRRLLGNAKKTSNLASSGLDTCFVAAGRAEVNIYGTLSVMDIAAAVGILREAGGMITDAKGNEIQITKETKKIYSTNNKEINKSIIDLLES